MSDPSVVMPPPSLRLEFAPTTPEVSPAHSARSGSTPYLGVVSDPDPDPSASAWRNPYVDAPHLHMAYRPPSTKGACDPKRCSLSARAPFFGSSPRRMASGHYGTNSLVAVSPRHSTSRAHHDLAVGGLRTSLDTTPPQSPGRSGALQVMPPRLCLPFGPTTPNHSEGALNAATLSKFSLGTPRLVQDEDRQQMCCVPPSPGGLSMSGLASPPVLTGERSPALRQALEGVAIAIGSPRRQVKLKLPSHARARSAAVHNSSPLAPPRRVLAHHLKGASANKGDASNIHTGSRSAPSTPTARRPGLLPARHPACAVPRSPAHAVLRTEFQRPRPRQGLVKPSAQRESMPPPPLPSRRPRAIHTQEHSPRTPQHFQSSPRSPAGFSCPQSPYGGFSSDGFPDHLVEDFNHLAAWSSAESPDSEVESAAASPHAYQHGEAAATRDASEVAHEVGAHEVLITLEGTQEHVCISRPALFLARSISPVAHAAFCGQKRPPVSPASEEHPAISGAQDVDGLVSAAGSSPSSVTGSDASSVSLSRVHVPVAAGGGPPTDAELAHAGTAGYTGAAGISAVDMQSSRKRARRMSRPCPHPTPYAGSNASVFHLASFGAQAGVMSSSEGEDAEGALPQSFGFDFSADGGRSRSSAGTHQDGQQHPRISDALRKAWRVLGA